MSLFFSTLAESLLTELSLNMDILEQLHTVSIEFTVMRENSLPVGLEVNIRYLLTEQKLPKLPLPPISAEIFKKNTNHGRIPPL